MYIYINKFDFDLIYMYKLSISNCKIKNQM